MFNLSSTTLYKIDRENKIHDLRMKIASCQNTIEYFKKIIQKQEDNINKSEKKLNLIESYDERLIEIFDTIDACYSKILDHITTEYRIENLDLYMAEKLKLKLIKQEKIYKPIVEFIINKKLYKMQCDQFEDKLDKYLEDQINYYKQKIRENKENISELERKIKNNENLIILYKEIY